MKGRSELWWIGATCFALWVCAIAIFLGTAVGLPRFAPGGPRTGCYLTDAMLVYVECSPELFAGDVIEFVANSAWWLVLYSWAFAAPILLSGNAGTPRAVVFVAAWSVGAGVTLTAAAVFVVAQIIDWISWRRV